MRNSRVVPLPPPAPSTVRPFAGRDNEKTHRVFFSRVFKRSPIFKNDFFFFFIALHRRHVRSDVEREEQSVVGCCYVYGRERVRHVRRRRRNRRLRRGVESRRRRVVGIPMIVDGNYDGDHDDGKLQQQQQRRRVIMIPRIYRLLGNGCDVYGRSGLPAISIVFRLRSVRRKRVKRPRSNPTMTMGFLRAIDFGEPQ